MTSDEQRREVAQKLRETCDEIERTGNGLTVWELTDILNIRDDDSGMIESLNLDDARNLADLIDRPTCRNVGDDYMFKCSECGAEFEPATANINEYGDAFYPPLKPLYCSVCGAEVIVDED